MPCLCAHHNNVLAATALWFLVPAILAKRHQLEQLSLAMVALTLTSVLYHMSHWMSFRAIDVTMVRVAAIVGLYHAATTTPSRLRACMGVVMLFVALIIHRSPRTHPVYPGPLYVPWHVALHATGIFGFCVIV